MALKWHSYEKGEDGTDGAWAKSKAMGGWFWSIEKMWPSGRYGMNIQLAPECFVSSGAVWYYWREAWRWCEDHEARFLKDKAARAAFMQEMRDQIREAKEREERYEAIAAAKGGK